jgi:probable HAF family extracellular repeat protein
MSYSIQLRPFGAAARALVGTFALLTLATSCTDQAALPTTPSIARAPLPAATIVGADVVVLPTLGGRYTVAADINDAGQVVGTSYLPEDSVSHAFLWSPERGMLDLGTLGGRNSSANAINELGQVVGSSQAPGRERPFLWTPERGMQDLVGLGGERGVLNGATDINDVGQVVGYTAYVSGGVSSERAFLWTQSGGIQDIGSLGGVQDIGVFSEGFTHPAAINNAGQVVGESQVRKTYHGFLWTAAGGMQDLGTLSTLDGLASHATDINESGQIVGSADADLWPLGLPTHAVLWTPGAGMQDLWMAVDARSNSSANGINDLGQVVGGSTSGLFVWTAANGVEFLHPTEGYGSLAKINNHGQAVGGNRVITLRFSAPNRAPVVTVGGPYAAAEGAAVTLALSATDADGDALTFSWDLGDGTTGSGPTPPASHVYTDNGSYSVRLTASDGKGGTDTRTTTATIANAAPTIPTGGLTGPSSPVRLIAGSANVPITLAFTDPAGPNDRYAAAIQCGNGTSFAAVGIESPYTRTCTYASPGLYTLQATVSDEDGGTSAAAVYRYVIIYDPEGSFVTGSGFYLVPGQSRSKTHFTFSAKFLPGAPLPNGSLELWIPGGRFDFESTGIDMLVASGNRAQFWGMGTLNGAAARFRVSVVDGDAAGSKGTPDAIRIELWDATGSTVLYDTQPGAERDAPVTTPIEAGSIQIHHR